MGIAIQANTARQRSQPTPDINVTPLVDVVLVLLIIFMVIAPALEHGERVELPGVLQPDKTPKGKVDPITVTLGRQGSVFVEKAPVAIGDLPGHLAAVRAADPDRRVVLKGDGAVGYQKVRDVFQIVQGAGFSGVSLQVSQRGTGSPERTTEE